VDVVRSGYIIIIPKTICIHPLVYRKLCRAQLLSIFDAYINEERSPGYGESKPCEYSRLLMCKKSGLELGLALAAGLLGNLAAEKDDRSKELTWHAEKALPEERKPQDIL
jgi:hypothetical protein